MWFERGHRDKNREVRQFGHIERMNESRLRNEIYRADVERYIRRDGHEARFQTGSRMFLKTVRVRSEKNNRACMTRLMNVSEA